MRANIMSFARLFSCGSSTEVTKFESKIIPTPKKAAPAGSRPSKSAKVVPLELKKIDSSEKRDFTPERRRFPPRDNTPKRRETSRNVSKERNFREPRLSF
jgi:hypothetical protein